MIELNLLEKKNTFKAPEILGIDLGKLPWKSIIASWALTTFPLDYLKEEFVKQQEQKSEEVKTLGRQLSKLKVQLRKNQGIKEQLSAFNKQIEKLKQRSEQVDKIIKLKTNPRYLLEKIARSTPPDLWFNELQITNDDAIFIKGAAESYRSIGEFILEVNESPFFGKSLQLKDSKTEEEEVKGVKFRIENFKIEGNVTVYDPFMSGR